MNKKKFLFIFLIGLFFYIIFYTISNSTKELLGPINIQKIKNINYIEINSNIYYTIGNTELYPLKTIKFYNYDKNEIIAIVKDKNKNKNKKIYGIQESKIYNSSLKKISKPLNLEKLSCQSINKYDILNKDKIGLNVIINTDHKKIKIMFDKKYIYIQQFNKDILDKNNYIKKIKNFKCNFDINLHKNFIKIISSFN